MAKSISDLSWNETSLEATRELFWRQRKKSAKYIRASRYYKNKHQEGEVCSGLASTYYTIVGRAWAKKSCLWHPSWAFLFAWCYWRMYPVSRRGIELSGGVDGASVDQLDIHQSVCRKRGKWEEALGCIETALDRRASGHTRGLLLVGLAEIKLRSGNIFGAGRAVDEALSIARQVEGQEPKQAGRIYKNSAAIFRALGYPEEVGECLRRAGELAEQTGAKDQTAKIDSLASC